jgi:endonuclease/exonuclease/phosphatase family metal-dependent hydrolase
VSTSLTDAPPGLVAAELRTLRDALDECVPPKVLDRNLLIGTWNIRAFGDLTEKWYSESEDSPKRDLASLLFIAEILSRFDVVAVQEVRGNLKALRHVLKVLGDAWGMILTDVTKGSDGNDERLAFLFDTRRVKPSGLACELVLPPTRGDNGSAVAVRQFARTPYAVSFTAGADTFILVTLHVRFGSGPADRVDELEAIAQWLADWAQRENDWGHNLLALGDFNIDRKADPLHQAFTSTGLAAPSQLDGTPRTIFDDSVEGHFYDQIAWFTGTHGVPALSMDYTGAAGGFDFVPHVMTSLTKAELSWRVSDHYPLWAEFTTRRLRHVL